MYLVMEVKVLLLERFSLDCRKTKTKTKVNTLAKQRA